MRICRNILVLVLAVFLAACDSSSLNTKENFDFGWKFYAGEVKGAEQPDFDDSGWRDLDLPHDWSIEGVFSRGNPSFSRGGWLPTGKVVYRKTFWVPSHKKDKRFVIYFDGAYRNSKVFVNGHLLGFRPMGYIGFFYDMTPYIHLQDKNVITVKLDNSSQPGSRWYTGTGIYRHVSLITTNKIFIPIWQNHIVANEYSDEKANVKIESVIQNDFDGNRSLIVQHKAFAPDGTVVATVEKKVWIEGNTRARVKVGLEIPDPILWSLEHPNLYTIQTDVLADNEIVYSEKNKTGIRTLAFDNDNGFKLNGEVTKLKGVCLHAAGGPLGAAVHRRTIERQLEKLREMGCNAVRTAHNPFSEEFLSVCDSMGFLVLNECFDEWEVVKEPSTTQDGKKIRIPVDYYARHFRKWADTDLTDFVLRDRNHPSVIMWSIGNEIEQMRHPDGELIGRRLAAIVHQLDYRPVTNGVNGYGWGRWPNPKAVATSDVYGYNYIKEEGLAKERKQNPEALMVITEHESAQSFYPRSTYLFGEAKKEWWRKLDYKYDDAYEWVETRGLLGTGGMTAWAEVKKHPYVMGLFIWTGWDYLGEVIPYGWPARSSCFAPIDLAGFPKDGFFFYQSQWTQEPMVHIFPHWNQNGMEGKKITVYGFTNGDEVELFKNGVSLGKQKNDLAGVEYQKWNVVYEPGKLKAVAYKKGRVIAEKVVRTAGAPAKIRIDTRRTQMKANGQDLIYVECTILDKDGVEVPTANNLLEFEVKGPAVIAGVGNGDNMGLEPFKANSRSAFNGKCLAIIQSTKERGTITCSVKSKGITGERIVLEAK